MFYKGKHDREKQLRFSIRKVSFGAASVVIAAFTMFIGGGTVQADAIQSNDSSSASVSSNHQPKDSDKKTDNEDRVNTSNLKESEATFENTEPKDVISSTESFNNESRQEEKQFIKADTSKLELAVARVQALLEKTKVNEKTEEVIKSANEELAKAQDLLSNDKVIQGDIDKELSSLNNIDFILKSIPTASIEKKLEKENKNQDPRNGKAIPGKGESGFRAEETRNVESKILENGNITASGTITTNDRMGNYSPTKFSYNVKLKDGSYHENDKISITFEELGSGSSLPETLSKDGKVFARRESIEELFTNEAAKGKKTSFWAQRDDSASLEEKEQAKLKNRGTKTRFTYKFTSAIESLKDVSFGGALNDYSLRYPEVSEDKLVTAKILVNNQTVVEKEYTVNKTNIKQEKPSEAPSTISSSGTLEFVQNGELINHSEQFNFSTNKYEYGVGTTFTIKLNDKSLNKFVKSGEFKKVRANLSNKSTTANTKINEEHVILKSPRTYAEFQVISLTDDEVVVKIVGGKATSDTNYSFDWSAAGVSREPVSNTVNLYHSQTGKFGPVNETVKITKENSSDDLSGQYTTNMEISWDNPKKNSFDASGNWLKEYLELGNVAMRYINVANNNPILKATSIVKGGVAEVDKFATATPTKDFTEANVATEANNTTKKEETQNDNVKTTTATAPYIIKGTDNKYYVFREYLKNSPYKRTSTSGTVYDAVSNIVAAYDEAKYGKVTVKYVKANDTATVLRENVLKDATAKLENIVGTNYSVTPEEEFSENGVVYKLVKTDLPNNSNGVLSENPTEVVYKYVVKNQKANVVIKTTDGKHSTTVELTGEPGTALPNSEDITNKIKDLKGKGYEVESDTYNVNGAHPDFDEQEDIEAGVSKPSQTFEITLKPRIVEVPSSTPHEKDSPVDPNGENPDLKWPDGLKESDLNTTAKRVISYVKKDSNTAAEEKALDDTVQTVSFTRKAKVNLVDKTVEYTDWESSNQTWEKVEVKTLVGYLADKKEIPAKEAVTPEKDTKVIPDETDKVTYTKIGSWTPINPTTGLEETPIPFPNDPTDPTKTGEITEIIPHKDGYTPKDGSGNSLTPIDPEHLDKGYHPPKITDPKANIKITYEKDDQKAKVKFVSVDPKTQQETELTDHALMLTGKTGETISERDVQTRIDVLKSMGYDIVDNPFDKNPVFDTLKDTTDKVSQEFIIKVQPRVSTAYPVYVVEGTKPSSEQLKDAVSTKGNDKTVDETKIPETTGKVGDDSLTVPITVTYGSGDKKREETVNVPVKVVKGYPQIVPVDEDKKQPYPEDSIDPDQYPEGSTFEYKEEVNTSEAGDKNVTVVVKDKAGNKLVEVPATVRVVESYPQYVPVNKEGISPKDSIDPSKFPEGTTFEYKEKPNTGSTGDKDVTVVAKLGTEIVAEIPAKIVVVDSKTQYVAENKENAQPDASKSVDEENYPEGSKFKFKEPVETSKAGDKETTVVVTDKDGNPLVEVPATVVVAKGYPQIVPVSEGNEQPSVKDSIDPDQYPEGSTFEYKEEVNTSEAGDKNVTVVVKDKAGNKLVEVPATVRVVESYPQYVPVNKEGISPKDSIDPSKFPEGTTFEYKEKPNTGSTGDKDVTVVAKLGTEIVAEIPAKIVVVDSKTQYVAENKENTQPDASKSVDEENYPEGSKFKFKEPVETSKAGDKETTVVVTDKDGNPLVEVPATVVVAKGYPQIVPVSEGNEQPSVKDSIDPDQYPEGSTFEYKEEVNTSEAGDKNVTVVVKDKAGNKLVEVPATVRVVESYPQYVPVNKEGISPKDSIDPSKFPEGTTFEYKEKPNTGSTGDKDVTVVAKLGTEIVAEIPAKIVVVDSKTQYVAENKENTQPDASKSVDEENYPEGSKFKFKEPVETSKAGDKETTVVVTDKDGNPLVEVPATVVVAKGYPQIVPVSEGNEQPSVKDSIDPAQYPEGSTFEYKEEVNTSEAGDKNVTVVVKDKAGNKLVEVPATVRVVESYPQYVPVNKEGISPKDSIDPSKFPEGTTFEYKEKPNTGSTGDKDVTVVAKLGTEIVAEIPAKIVVVDSKTQYVAENKENAQPDASKSVDEENYPEGSKFKFKEPVETSKAGDKETTVVVTDKDGNPLVEVPATVVVAKGYPQIVPVSEGNEQPSVKDSIDPDQYPEGSTFEYKEEVNTSEAGDKNVTVVVKDKAGNKLVEVPATVRVVESYPQYVPVNKEGISPKDSIDPSKFPEGTTFEYKEKPNTGSTGDKDVTVVAKLGTEIVAEIPAKIVVVDSKTQYVAENKENTQPDASKSVDEENYPEGSKFKFKEPVETSKAGDKETTVVVTDKDGNPLVEVPATVVVAKGYSQIVPVSEGNEQPSVKDSIDPDQYPEGSTFEYKEEVNTSEAGDKNVTVVVKDKAGNKLVEVPATVRVVESYPQYVPVNKEGISPKDSIDPSKFPEGTTFEYKEKPNTGSTGDKDVTVVAKLGTEIVAEIPAKIVVVDSKTQYVAENKENAQPDASKSVDEENYPEGSKFKFKEPVETSKAGDKETTVVVTDKDGNPLVEVPATVVVAKGYSQIVPVSEGNEQPSVKDSIDPDQYPEGSTFEYKEEVNTSEAGDKNVTVVVKDKAGNKLVEVPATVRVVESYPQYVPVNKEGISPKDSIDPSKFPEGTTFEYKEKPNTGSTGDKDVTVVAKLGTEIVAEIHAKIVVVDSKTQYVAENKENTQPDASKSVDEENYPEGSKFKFKEPVETSKVGDKETTVVVTDKDGNPLVEVPATVVVAKGYPQIVPVSEGNKQPSVKDSIDPDQYPEGSTFEYKEEVNTSEAGDKNVTVVVKDKAGNKLVEVPATVRVVESYPQYVPVNKEGISPKDSIDPSKFPEGTTFEYKEKPNTGSAGDKDVTVVAKLGTEIVAEIPAKIVVVDSKTQYVPVDKSNKQPDASKSIDPEQYPDGVTFKYKTPVDTTTPGEKDVIVEAKDGEDKLVEVPAKVKVVEGKEQLIPVNTTEKPQARDSITPSDYPEGSTFEYKVPDGQKEPFDATTVGDKPVTVVVKDKNGNVLVEVPATIKVVEAKPKPIETPVTNTPLTKDDIAKYVKVPEGGKVTNVEKVPDLTTPGKKTPVKVTVELPNGKTITVEVPVNVTPVKGIETPVTNTPLTPEDYTKGITIPEGGKVTNVENIPDLTTPGKKTPVKVTVELPNGKTVTVDVPVNVTPVKGIETPVTNTPLTPEDYTKGITIPEGGKVTNVENVPDLTTSGKKTPVKVTVELPNGKTITVDVPVNVTPVKGIETPVTNTPLTPEDYTKGITIPEGGKVTNVENIPDLTTPGKKTPVKVTVELPNGKTVTVDVPVEVTPVKGIETPVTKRPLTPEDYTKGIKIPEGGKVTNVENIPDLTTPGKKDPVKVTVELPNGKTITVDVPVNVTPATGIETPVTDTPLTKEDIEKNVKVPEGGKVVGVGEIPKVNTPGDKGTVKVKIELPNGKQIEVEVPVNVTPIKDIVKKLGDPITNEDIEKHIQIPEGGKIISIGDKPSTDVPGERPSVPVVIELPGGKRVTVKVPVIVTPKTTPVVVEVGTPITEDMVKQHVDLPEGWKITKVGEIPKTNTPGDKPSVTVEIELPDGRKVTVEVPVKVTPKSNHGNIQGNNGSSTTHIVTRYQDGDGKEISPNENGSHGPKTLEGYEYIGTKTDKNGNVIHTYKKVTIPTRSEQPSSPETPTSPEKPVATPVQTSSTDSKPVAVETTVANDKKELPNTGTEDKSGLASLGLLGMLGAFGLVARKKKED